VVPASGNSSTIRCGITNSAKRRSGASWCRRKRFTAEASGDLWGWSGDGGKQWKRPKNGGNLGKSGEVIVR